MQSAADEKDRQTIPAGCSVEISDHCDSAISRFDYDRIINDLEGQIDGLKADPDTLDYFVSIGSGITCALLDILWTGEFSLEQGRNIADDQVKKFVGKTARLVGYNGDDPKGAVEFLEKKFHIPADGNTSDFGGGLQHHLRDFAHHPTIVGLIFSLLTQFTSKSYGTDTNGAFMIVDVPEKSKIFIGNTVPAKIINGTIVWFFHLVSDMAGSGSTVMSCGGTGIPGPILALAKELSVTPFFKKISIDGNSFSVFLSKLFNGTLFAKRDASGKIIKDTVLRFDLRAEMGIGIEIGRQALPVIANESIVRTFIMLRRFISRIKELNITDLDGLKLIDWDDIKPCSGPSVSRMLLVASAVFSTVDIGDAIIKGKVFVNVNYVGIGRFAVAIGEDISWGLKVGRVKDVKKMYENMKLYFCTAVGPESDFSGDDNANFSKFLLTDEQIEILYNIEYLKTLNDIKSSKSGSDEVILLKKTWLREWKEYISEGFPSFTKIDGAEMHWLDEEALKVKVESLKPEGVWFAMVLLEAIIFEPYFTFTLIKDKNGNDRPNRCYKKIQHPPYGFRENEGDEYLKTLFKSEYYPENLVDRLRRCYKKSLNKVNELSKKIIGIVSTAAIVTAVAVALASAFAPTIAVYLVGSNFAGLHGAALTSAALAYMGGGAIAVGGAGMAGGTVAIVGGGAVLGLGIGAGVGSASAFYDVPDKRTAMIHTAKFMTAVKEIFLNQYHDISYSKSVLEQYANNITELGKKIVELQTSYDVAKGDEKKTLKGKIRRYEDNVNIMKCARKELVKFLSAYETGCEAEK